MNKDTFLRYVAASGECDEAALNAAVNKGLRRAKTSRPDFGKVAVLAAACVFSFAVCVTINLEPVKAAADTYRLNRNSPLCNNGEVLNSRVLNAAGNIGAFGKHIQFGSGH